MKPVLARRSIAVTRMTTPKTSDHEMIAPRKLQVKSSILSERFT